MNQNDIKKRLTVRWEAGVDADTANALARKANMACHLPWREFGDLCYSVRNWRGFFGVEEGEPIELCAFIGEPKRIWTAYPTTYDEHVTLLRMASTMPECVGCYAVFNRIDPAISHGPTWRSTRKRAKNQDITAIRAVYIDIDPVRASGTSATNDERRYANRVLRATLFDLRDRGIPWEALAHGESGNGFSVFVAVNPTLPSESITSGIRALLKAIDQKHGSRCVAIDPTVANPARLGPAFGTMKRKGENTKKRPHRQTLLACLPFTTSVDIEAVLGPVLSEPGPKNYSQQPWHAIPVRSASRRATVALKRECEALASTARGSRNYAANVAAVKLGHFVAAGELGEAEVFEALLEAMKANGSVRDDGRDVALKTIRSGLACGKRTLPSTPQNQNPAYLAGPRDFVRLTNGQ